MCDVVEKTLLPETIRKKLEFPEGATYSDAVALAVILWENGGGTARMTAQELLQKIRDFYNLDHTGSVLREQNEEGNG